jgi:thiol-disulfide isomerase/thioredoxin
MKFFLSFIFATCLIFNSLAQNFVIKGKIKNPLENRVSIAIYNLYDDDIKVKIPLDVNGEFYYSTKLNDVAFLQFDHSGINSDSTWQLKDIIIEPNDEVEMDFDAKNFWESVAFKGKSSEKFNYYKEFLFEKALKTEWVDQFYLWAIDFSKPMDEQLKLLDNAEIEQYKMLEKYKNKVSDVFYKIQQAECKAEVSNLRWIVLYNLRPVRQLNNQQKEAFYTYLPSQSDTTAKGSKYLYYIIQLMEYIYNEMPISSKSINIDTVSQMIKYKLLLNPNIAERLSSENTLITLKINGINEESLKQYNEFKSLYPQSKYQNKIENIYQTKLQNKGSTAFAFKTLENNELKIEDFKGKIVLLDFWASWYKPCLAEMRHANKVKEHFKNRNDLVFLYLSSDTDEQEWKDAIEKYKITGINGMMSQAGIDEVRRKFMVSNVQTYKLILKDGSMLNKTVPRPSHNEGKDLINLLEEVLRK